jgi:glutathione synthase/RimK-type ligase-like ATP-grasp enzyme
MGRAQPGFVVVTDSSRMEMLDGLPTLAADEYLEGAGGALDDRTTVVNLCRSHAYLSKGYYVSLLADARHHTCLPNLRTIQDLRNPFTYLRVLAEAGVPVADARTVRERKRVAAPRAAAVAEVVGAGGYDAPLPEPAAVDAPPEEPVNTKPYREIWSVFGRSRDSRHADLCAAVFETYALPLARLRLYEEDGAWKVGQVAPLAITTLDPPDLDLLWRELGAGRFLRPRANGNGPKALRIACLWDPADTLAASDRDTLDVFAHLAARRGLRFERIGREDLASLAEYDGLFIRTVTAIDHWSFTFAQMAESLDIPVIDDPQSILKCSNKVYLQELFKRNAIASPLTRTISRKTPFEEVRALGFPLIVKQPDGTFSQAVKKADDRAEFDAITAEMFKRSPLLIVQEFTPTNFDWRVGVLANRVLFVCKYHMAEGHWQIVKVQGGERDYGRVEAVPLELAPPAVLQLALESTALVGDGLYGVDLKDTPRGPVVIEINDNPNMQVGYEDAAEGERIYEAVLSHFVSRIRSRAGAGEAR